MDKIQEVKAAVCEIGKKMYHSGLVAGTWGNISARIDSDYMVVTPSGMNYDSLNANDMVVVNMNDLTHEGVRKPSVEVPMHATLLKAYPALNAVVHTHSSYALTLATAGRSIPAICDDQVQILGGDIRVAPHTPPGTQEMADAILKAIDGRMGALIGQHGAVTMGRTLNEAFVAAQVLEKTSMVYLGAEMLGGAMILEQSSISGERDFFLHKYGQG